MTSYEIYIKKSLSFILKKNKICAIKPKLVEPIIFDWDSHYIMYELGNSKFGRFSDLLDEYNDIQSFYAEIFDQKEKEGMILDDLFYSLLSDGDE